MLTLHNVGYQGLFPGAQFEKTGLPPSLFTPAGLEYYGMVNLLKGGIVFADYVTTVSPTYAREILTSEFGFGLEGVLRDRADNLLGILNGIDIDRWNPETDSYLSANYSVIDRSGKLVCKQALQREFQLAGIIGSASWCHCTVDVAEGFRSCGSNYSATAHDGSATGGVGNRRAGTRSQVYDASGTVS